MVIVWNLDNLQVILCEAVQVWNETRISFGILSVSPPTAPPICVAAAAHRFAIQLRTCFILLLPLAWYTGGCMMSYANHRFHLDIRNSDPRIWVSPIVRLYVHQTSRNPRAGGAGGYHRRTGIRVPAMVAASANLTCFFFTPRLVCSPPVL